MGFSQWLQRPCARPPRRSPALVRFANGSSANDDVQMVEAGGELEGSAEPDDPCVFGRRRGHDELAGPG